MQARDTEVGGNTGRDRSKIAIIMGTLAHRRLTNTFKDIVPRYRGVVISAKRVYPIGGDLGLPTVRLTSIRDIVRRIPRVRSRITWGPDQYLFGFEAALADIDLVLAHGAGALYSGQAARYCSKTGKPLIVQEVGLVPFRDLGSRWCSNRMLALSTARVVVAVTERARARLIIEAVPKEKIRLIPFGIDTQLFNPGVGTPETRKQFGLSEDEVVILAVGNLRWDKGVFDLVHAAKLLADDPDMSRLRLRFVFAGGGYEGGLLQERINRLNLADTCRLIGTIGYDKMPAVYAASDMVAIPSIPGRGNIEQCPLVLHESMATGIPLIGTYCGGMVEVIGRDGILAHPNDPVSLAEGIKKLALNPDLRKEFAAAGLAKVKAIYDSRVVGSQYADLFDEVLACNA